MEFNFSSIDFNLYLFDLATFGLGIYFLLKKFLLSKSNNDLTKSQTASWDLTWTDAFLVLWALVFSVVLSQTILNQLKPETVPLAWSQILLSGTTHGVTIIFLYSLKYFNIINFFEKINNKTYTILSHTKNGIIYYLISIPLIWITSKLWIQMLEFFKFLGLKINTPNQELVELFSETQNPMAIIIMSVIAVAVAPIAEEFVFRAGIYRFLKGKLSPMHALIISSLLFSILHFNILSLMPLFILGLLLCRSYEKSGSIITSILLHALFNLNTLIHLTLEKIDSVQ